MPYFCLRVPTGGGKTWWLRNACALVNAHLLRSETASCCGDASRPSGTRHRLLKDRLRAARGTRGAGPWSRWTRGGKVVDSPRGHRTLVIVSTYRLQPRGNGGAEGLPSSGALMQHFENLAETQRAAHRAERQYSVLARHVLRSAPVLDCGRGAQHRTECVSTWRHSIQRHSGLTPHGYDATLQRLHTYLLRVKAEEDQAADSD